MQLRISDKQQPRPYLAPFSYNTSITDRQMDNHDKGPTFKLTAQRSTNKSINASIS